MVDVSFYWIFLALCSIYILTQGGPPERVAIAIAITASALSLFVGLLDWEGRYRSMLAGVFLVDVATLLAFGILALRADRFWPLWITGIHLIGVATHFAKLLDPSIVPRVYGATQALWAYPILLIIAIGAARHRRRLKRLGADTSWNSSFVPSGQTRQRPGPTA
jgi:hypothetical protein